MFHNFYNIYYSNFICLLTLCLITPFILDFCDPDIPTSDYHGNFEYSQRRGHLPIRYWWTWANKCGMDDFARHFLVGSSNRSCWHNRHQWRDVWFLWSSPGTPETACTNYCDVRKPKECVLGHGIFVFTNFVFLFPAICNAFPQVTVSSLMGGPAKRVWPLDPQQMSKKEAKSTRETYDAAVAKAACDFGKRMHNFVFQNCHHHVAMVLNEVQYGGRTDWNQTRVFWSIWRRGQWVSRSACLSAFTPSIIILIVMAGFVCFFVFRGF